MVKFELTIREVTSFCIWELCPIAHQTAATANCNSLVERQLSGFSFDPLDDWIWGAKRSHPRTSALLGVLLCKIYEGPRYSDRKSLIWSRTEIITFSARRRVCTSDPWHSSRARARNCIRIKRGERRRYWPLGPERLTHPPLNRSAIRPARRSASPGAPGRVRISGHDRGGTGCAGCRDRLIRPSPSG